MGVPQSASAFTASRAVAPADICVMAEDGLPPALTLLVSERNLAADTALIEALPHLAPHLQSSALDVLVNRANVPALTAIICGFRKHPEHLQRSILQRVKGFRPGMHAAMAAATYEDRFGAIELISAGDDAKSAYLLVEALQHRCRQTRERAAVALNRMTARVLEPPTGSLRADEIREFAARAHLLAEALCSAVKSWEIHRQPKVLEAALWLSDQVEPAIREKLQEPQSKLSYTLIPILAYASDPRLAGAVLRALAVPEFRAAASAAIGRNDKPEFIRALFNECWLIADPEIERGCRWVRDGRWVDAWANEICRTGDGRAVQALRFLGAAGETGERRVDLFRTLLGVDRIELRKAVLWRLVDDPSSAASELLAMLAARSGDEVAEIAGRECRRRDPPVRKAPPATGPAGVAEASHLTEVPRPEDRGHVTGAARAAQCPVPSGPDALERYFQDFDHGIPGGTSELPRAGLPLTADLIALLRAKLRSPVPAERIRAVRMAATLNLVKELDEQVYHLTYDPDPTVRAVAVATLVGLPGPTTMRILRSALNDRDGRVQANAIEVLEELGLSDRMDAVAEKLASPNSRVRANAVKALLRMELRAAAEALLDMLEDKSRAHRLSALWVVERLGLQTVLYRIHDLSRTDPDEQVRRRARRVLDHLSPKACGARSGGRELAGRQAGDIREGTR